MDFRILASSKAIWNTMEGHRNIYSAARNAGHASWKQISSTNCASCTVALYSVQGFATAKLEVLKSTSQLSLFWPIFSLLANLVMGRWVDALLELLLLLLSSLLLLVVVATTLATSSTRVASSLALAS